MKSDKAVSETIDKWKLVGWFFKMKSIGVGFLGFLSQWVPLSNS